jgi:hypothetical protein
LLRFVPPALTYLAPAISAVGFGSFAAFAYWIGKRHTAEQRRPGWPLGSGTLESESVFLMNMAVILVFPGKVWSMGYVWMILPMALFLAHLLDQPIRRWYLTLCGAAAVLLVSKIYGYPILDSLNLFGSALLLIALSVRLLRRQELRAPSTAS